jgi:hypothetical protein
MTNAETITNLNKARDHFVRVTLAMMLDTVGGDDDELIRMLAEVMDAYAHDIARRKGQYARAAALGVMVKHLEGLDKFIENYDPTVE